MRPAYRCTVTWTDVHDRDWRVTCNVGAYHEAQTSGPPDRWAEAEGGEVEIVEVRLDGGALLTAEAGRLGAPEPDVDEWMDRMDAERRDFARAEQWEGRLTPTYDQICDLAVDAEPEEDCDPRGED